MEQSLVLIKPDSAVRRRVSALVVDALLAKGYKIQAFREMKVPVPLAKKHYAIHKDKPFFGWLVDFITSARVLAIVFAGDNVIQGIRDALGATFVQKAAPDSLRGRYGIWAGINVAHASDALDTAVTEIALWTKEGGLVQSADADAKARAYITKHKTGNADYTADIRRIVRTAIEQKRSSPGLVSSLEKLFSKDAEGVHQSEIGALARSIDSFIKDEIAKV
jgi:nucleoside-diphosphate kinase